MDAAEPYQELANALNNKPNFSKYIIQYGGTTLTIVDPKRIRNGLNVSEMELKIRRIAFKAIMDTYTDLNTNHKDRSEATYTYEFIIPGWYPIPVYPSRIFGASYPKKYDLLSNYSIPKFDQSMDSALASLKTKSGWAMECTSAQKIVQYAILNATVKSLADKLLTTEFLDSKLTDQGSGVPYPSIQGYGGKNKGIIDQYLARGVITQDQAESMVLDKQKAKRMLTFIQLVGQFYNEVLRDTELRTGDTFYIWGHPNYSARHPNGAFPGENTFFAGYNERGLKLFMGFGKNFLTGPKQLKEVQAWLALEYLGLHDFPEANAARYKKEMETIITQKKLPANPSPFAKAFFEIRSQLPTVQRPIKNEILNTAFIQEVWEAYPDMIPKEGGKRKSTRRHKRQRRSTVKRRNLAIRRTRRA